MMKSSFLRILGCCRDRITWHFRSKPCVPHIYTSIHFFKLFLACSFLWVRSWQVDDDQLVYLQNLILVSNGGITDAFGVYEEDQDPVRLAESLKQVGLVVFFLHRGALFVSGPLCGVLQASRFLAVELFLKIIPNDALVRLVALHFFRHFRHAVHTHRRHRYVHSAEIAPEKSAMVFDLS